MEEEYTPEPREKPTDAPFFGWEEFEKLADENGYGNLTEDWEAWWICWKAGYQACGQADFTTVSSV